MQSPRQKLDPVGRSGFSENIKVLGTQTPDLFDDVTTWINNRHSLVEVDHLADAHLVKHGLEGATLCGRVTVHKRQFPAHKSVRRCRKCIKAATEKAMEELT